MKHHIIFILCARSFTKTYLSSCFIGFSLVYLLSPEKEKIYSSDEEDSDFETTRPKKNFKGKVLKDSDEESNATSDSASGSGGEEEAAAGGSD